jgi:hypothetical protein
MKYLCTLCLGERSFVSIGKHTFRWWLPLVNRSHTASEYTWLSRSSNINSRGLPRSSPNLSGRPSWYRMFFKLDRSPGLFTITPDDSTTKFCLGTLSGQVLQKFNTEGCFSRTCWSTDYGAERMFKLEVDVHGMNESLEVLHWFIYQIAALRGTTYHARTWHFRTRKERMNYHSDVSV